MKEKRSHFVVPVKLHRRLKQRAKRNGMKLTFMVERLIRIGLSHEADMIPTTNGK